MKDKTLDEPITEVVETIDLGSLEVRHVFAEELADERRSRSAGCLGSDEF